MQAGLPPDEGNSMNSPYYLRPMDFRDVLDDTFDLYKENFILFVTITAIVYLPFQLVLGTFRFPGAGSPATDPAVVWGSLLSRSPGLILWIFAYYLTVGALTTAVSERYLGRKITPREAYRSILGRFGAFVWTLFLNMILLGAGIMLLALAAALLIGGIAAFGGAVGIVIAVVFGLIFAAAGFLYAFSFSFVIPVFALEGKSGRTAIQRSAQLVFYRPLKIAGSIMLIGFITAFISGILMMPVALLTGALGGSGAEPSRLAGLASGAFNGIVQALIQPIQLTVIVLLYYDVRIRREGFDLEMLANELRGSNRSEPSPAFSERNGEGGIDAPEGEGEASEGGVAEEASKGDAAEEREA
jgi:hypothetical protein